MKTLLNFIGFYFLIYWGCFSLIAQESDDVRINTNSEHIQWIKQFPPANNALDRQEGAKKLKDFVFGKKDLPRIQKPMYVIASNPDTFILMDQSNGIIFQIRNLKYDVPRNLKKKFTNFNSMVAMCSLPDGEILFTDSKLNKVFRITSGNKNLLTFNDTLTLLQPTGIAYSKTTDEIWVLETGAHRIAILDRKGNLIKRIGQRGNGDLEFNFPTYIWIDKDGKVYIVDTLNYRVQILDNVGTFISSFGEAGDATGFLARPKGIATDSEGNIYLADALFHCVQIFDKQGRFLYNFGKQGRNPGEFWIPSGIFIDDKDFIYVADTYNARIQIFHLIKNE